MPVTLSKLAAQTASVTIPIEGDTLTVSYYPNKVTDKLIRKLQAQSVSASQMMADLISQWDLYEDEQQTVMYPLTADRIEELGVPVLEKIIWAIVQDMRPEAKMPQTMNSGV